MILIIYKKMSNARNYLKQLRKFFWRKIKKYLPRFMKTCSPLCEKCGNQKLPLETCGGSVKFKKEREAN